MLRLLLFPLWLVVWGVGLVFRLVGGIFKAVLLIPLLFCLVVVMTFAGASVGVLMLAAFAVLALFIARWFFALLRGV